jgi:hypothetical protein
MTRFRSALSLTLAGAGLLLVGPAWAQDPKKPDLPGSSDAPSSAERREREADHAKLQEARLEIEILEARIAVRKAEIDEIVARSRRKKAETTLAKLVDANSRERLTRADVTRTSVPFPDDKTVPGLPPDVEKRIQRVIKDAVENKNRPILDALDKKIVMAYPDKTPLEDILKSIRGATKDEKLPNGIPIFVDTSSMPDAERAVRMGVTIRADDLPLRTSLGFVLSQAGLSWKVKDGLLFIIDKKQAVLDAMDNKVVMAFPDKTPLEDVVRYLRVATKNDHLPNGIPIVVDPSSIPDPELTMRKVVILKADDLTLKESLTLLLRQVDLVWTVKEGLLVISAAAKNPAK